MSGQRHDSAPLTSISAQIRDQLNQRLPSQASNVDIRLQLLSVEFGIGRMWLGTSYAAKLRIIDDRKSPEKGPATNGENQQNKSTGLEL